MAKKVCKIFLSLMIVVTCLLFYRPFSINAAGGSLTAPFIGYNYSITQYVFDREYEYDLNYSSSTSGTGSFQITSGSVTLSGPVQYGNYELYSSANPGGGLNNIKGTMTLPNTTVSADLTDTSHLDQYYIIEYEILLDNVYQGVVNITINGSTNDRYVNSNVIRGSFRSSTTSFNPNSSGSNIVLTVNSYTLVYAGDNVQLNFPFEAFSFVFEFLYNNVPLYHISTVYDYEFPMFTANSGDKLFTLYMGATDITMIIMINRLANTNLFNYLVPNDSTGLSVVSYELLNSDIITNPSTDYSFRLAKYTLRNTGTSRSVVFSSGINNLKIMPIYCNISTRSNISTDFAIRFGLKNDYLNNIEIMAQGTSESNQSISDLDSTQSQLDSTINSVDSYEQQFTADFNNSLNNVPTTITWASEFLTSANWVKTQFNNLTDNNVFGSVLTFSLILGISTLIIGKVFK